MRKFLETFPTIPIENLLKVYPDYNILFIELNELKEKVQEGVSVEAQEQYEQLMDTLDYFLLSPESIDAYNKANPLRPLNKELLPSTEQKISLQERQEIEDELEDEITELMQGIDKKVIESIIPEISKEKEIVGQKYVSRTKEDFDEEDRFVGLSFKYEDSNQTNFEKSLAMLSQGCKFYYLSFGAKYFVMFKLKGKGRIIIETSELRTRLDRIFFPNNKEFNVYILNNNTKELNKTYNLFDSAFSITVDEVVYLDDDFLYNTRYITASYVDGLLWKEAEEVQQSRGISLRSSYIEAYFSLSNPLAGLCTMQICREVHGKVNVDKDAKVKIENNIKNLKYFIEGIGNVSHSENILKELQEKNLLDLDYKLTPFGIGAMDYNMVGGKIILPEFRPFAYYMNNLQEKVKKSKNKYYSQFNGVTLYHIKKEVENIGFALSIPSNLKKIWDVNEAEQVDAFSVIWQQSQKFQDYVEYLPYGADGGLTLRKMDLARKSKEKQTFRDLERRLLYIASTSNNSFVWSIDAQNYSYIKKMYSQDNIRILGNNESSFSAPDLAFFMIVNDENNLLAVLPALKVNELIENVEVDNSGKVISNQQSIIQKYITSSFAEQPLPVWDVDRIMNNLEKKYPKLILEGKMIGEQEDIQFSEELKQEIKQESNNDIIIDLDNPENPIIELEDEKTLMIKELNEEILLLQELEQDELITDEINQIKEKLEALK